MKSKLEISNIGTKKWKLPNGKLHNEDGPAVEYFDGNKEYCLNHMVCSEQEYKKKMRLIKIDKIL